MGFLLRSRHRRILVSIPVYTMCILCIPRYTEPCARSGTDLADQKITRLGLDPSERPSLSDQGSREWIAQSRPGQVRGRKFRLVSARSAQPVFPLRAVSTVLLLILYRFQQQSCCPRICLPRRNSAAAPPRKKATRLCGVGGEFSMQHADGSRLLQARSSCAIHRAR